MAKIIKHLVGQFRTFKRIVAERSNVHKNLVRWNIEKES